MVASSPKITSHLAASLAYMTTGAFLLGIVQMLVALNAAGAGRLGQNLMLWVWAGVVAAAFYAVLKNFMDTMHENEVNRAALLGSVCSCAMAAMSPQIILWMTVICHRV